MKYWIYALLFFAGDLYARGGMLRFDRDYSHTPPSSLKATLLYVLVLGVAFGGSWLISRFTRSDWEEYIGVILGVFVLSAISYSIFLK